MSKWEDFATVEPTALSRAEDAPSLTSADDYAMFKEMKFLDIIDDFFTLPPGLSPQWFTDVRRHRMTTVKNHTLRQQSFTYAYHGFAGGVRYGKVQVTETEHPRGWRVDRYWNGKRVANRWISWREGITHMYADGGI